MKAVLFNVLFLTLCVPALLYGQQGKSDDKTKINKIVIDPGHGGHHPGAVYKKHLEKDITLSIALKLGYLIQRNLPEVEVIYTRTSDVYVDLADRSNMANKAGADLFLSIHINASESSAVNGTSTYIMGEEKGDRNLSVAMKENSVIIYEENYETRYEGYIPGDVASYIMFSYKQHAYMDQSMLFADIIQKNFALLPMANNGAYQGPFLVLWMASMPAVLTEIGYLSNEKDRSYITSNKGQSDAARSLFNAFSKYKSEVEGKAHVVLLKGSADTNDIKFDDTPAPITVTAQSSSSTSSQTTQEPSSETTKPRTPVQQISGDGIKFYVQIASVSKAKNINDPVFLSYKGKVIQKRSANGAFKYLVGGYDSYDQAVKKQSEVRREFKDAFIVAYDGDRSVELSRARGTK